ncbi:hypothetical protein SARC_07283, partial [Sphaeroforma arctica JP610]
TNKQQNEARLSIIEAVQMVTSAYDPVTMTTNVEKDLDTLLSKALLSEQGNVRLVAVQSARTIFPMSHVGSRYICMIGAGDTQDDVRECARAGLRAATVHEIPQLGAKAKAGQPVVKSPAANRGPGMGEACLKRVKTASGDASAPPVSHTTKCELIGFLIHTLDKARDAKAIDALILAVGLVGYGDPTLPKEAVDKILETLYSKEREKSPDLHFTVGMSLARIAHASTVVANQNASINSSRLPAIVEKVLVNSRSAVPPVRQSSAIWLLHVVKLNAKNKYITHEAVSEIQQAFVGYLGDGDEFTQECASNGLGLVYECGDGSLKESLVTTLVSTLSDGQKRSTKLTVVLNCFVTPMVFGGGLGVHPFELRLDRYR